jgi:hypothetical protein
LTASAHLAAGLVTGMVGSRLARQTAWRALIAFTLALASHVALDAIPHADYFLLRNRWVLLIALAESVVVGAIAFGVLRKRVTSDWRIVLTAGLAGTAIIDLRVVERVFPSAPLAHQLADFGLWIHGPFHATPSRLWVGMLTQVVAAVVLLSALALFPRIVKSQPAAKSNVGKA